MHTEDLKDPVERLLDDVDGPDVPELSDQPISEGAFTELVEGEVIEDPPHPRGIPLRWLMPIGIAALAVALVLALVIVPLFAESATIMITPDAQTLTAQGDITVPVRTLVHKTVTLSEQVQTTGTGYQHATVAHGGVTFYNSFQSPQTVYADRAFLIGADGVRITIDADITIPGGTLATNGSATVSAHADATGSGGNIRAGDLNGPCCQDYVFAYNSTFRGGQDAHGYRTASAADIAAAGTDLRSLTTTQLVDEAQQQLSNTEAMSQPLCTVGTTSAPKPGVAATQVTVSVTSTCSVYAYSRSDVTAQEHMLFMQAIQSQLGDGYGVRNEIHETIGRTTFVNGTLTASLTLIGDVMYRFQSDEIQHMQQLVAGKSREQATTLLLHVRGVHTVGIQIDHGKTTLPGNAARIALSVYDKE